MLNEPRTTLTAAGFGLALLQQSRRNAKDLLGFLGIIPSLRNKPA